MTPGILLTIVGVRRAAAADLAAMMMIEDDDPDRAAANIFSFCFSRDN